MVWVAVDQFRSTFVGDRVVLTAELSPPPPPGWLHLCRPLLDRYAAAFDVTPTLLDDTIVVSVNGHEIAATEAALRQVVDAANWLMSDPFGGIDP